MSKILSIKAREILDSRGNPTVECEIKTKQGLFRAAVPSGTSTGIYEALELRDNNKKRYLGKGVQKAVDNINNKISKIIKGKDSTKQEDIDKAMIKLDKTENKSNLGANSILAVSIAVCKAGAASKNIPLYKHIADLGNNKELILPVPMVLVLEGGKHADNSSDLQEFMIMPYKAQTFKQAIQQGSEIYQSIKQILKKQGFDIDVGYEGAYGPSLGSNEKVFQIIVEGIKKAGYKPGEDILIAIDSAASEFCEDNAYYLKVDGKVLNNKSMIDFYDELTAKYPIISIEDGLAQDDWQAWTNLTKKLGNKIQIMGDDLTVTNLKKLQKAISLKAINSILIKLNQIGTVTETIAAVNLAKKNNITSIVSHRSAETEDTFIADFVVGLGTKQCKFGAPARSERTAKYNQLLRIEEKLGKKAKYAGVEFRSV